MIKSHADYLDKFQECEEEIKELKSAGVWIDKE